MKILEKTSEKLVFVSDLSESLANALRRASFEVPVLAIDEVEIYKNDSVLYDEVLALRLGLIPFKMSKDMELKEECACKGKGCSKCTTELKLVAKGPGVVYAKDFKGGIDPVHGDIPIVELADEQELELVATLRLGKGVDHTKYNPGLVYYRHVAEIESGKCDDCKSAVEACPVKILKQEKGKIEFTDKYKCDMCEACVEACKREGKDCLKIVPGKEITFFIESWGQMKAEEILHQAAKAIKLNLKDLK